MATALVNLTDQAPTLSPRLMARVGAAVWTIVLDHTALEALRPRDGEPESIVFSASDLHRIMEGLRAKAVGLRWYGGGTMSLDADELAPAPKPMLDEDGAEIVARPWFEIIPTSENGQPAMRLVA